MTATGECHGPFKAREVDDPDQVDARQHLHCAHRTPRCLPAAQNWPAMSCISPNGEHCEAFELPSPGDLADELTALSAFAMWFVSGAQVDGPLETVRAALKANPGASISEISRKTGSSRAYVSRVRRLGR